MAGEKVYTYKEADLSWKELIDPIYNDYNGFGKAVEEALLENHRESECESKESRGPLLNFPK